MEIFCSPLLKEFKSIYDLQGFPGGLAGKEFTCSAEDLGSIPGLGRTSGEGNGYTLQYSDLENSMDYIVRMYQQITGEDFIMVTEQNEDIIHFGNGKIKEDLSDSTKWESCREDDISREKG